MKLFLRPALFTMLVVFSFVNSDPAKAESQDSAGVPSIKYAGIIPVYWQGSPSPALSRRKSIVDESFPKIIRESKRFNFLGDVIVEDNWSSAEGRKRLEDEFELDAYLNLNIAEQGDIVLFTARLLSPALENYVSETERIPAGWLSTASTEEIKTKIKEVSYRVLNRYPIDVFVNSLQGRYVTLSAGKDQNVFEGDELEFAEFSVKSMHPVDGTWLDFSSRPLGKARIIESKAQSSIAEITSLTSENAIRPGSGARVENIASRRSFRPAPKEEEVYVSEPNSPIVKPKGKDAPPPQPLMPASKPKVAAEAQAEVGPEEAPMHPAARGGVSAPSVEQSSASSSSGFPEELKNVRFSLESSSWSYGGAAKASASTSPILVNQVGGFAEFELDKATTTLWDLHLTAGSTSKGNYSGATLGGEYLIAVPSATALIPSLDRMLVGVRAEIVTLGVTKERFGGRDSAHLMPVVHAQGTYHIADLVETFRYDVSAKIIPLNFGTAGIKGKEESLGGSMGFDLEAQAIHQNKTETIEWGGLIGFRSVSFGLSKKSLDYSDVRIGLMGQVKL